MGSPNGVCDPLPVMGCSGYGWIDPLPDILSIGPQCACAECHTTVLTVDDLLLHISLYHVDYSPYHCELCPHFQVASFMTLAQHHAKVHPGAFFSKHKAYRKEKRKEHQLQEIMSRSFIGHNGATSDWRMANQQNAATANVDLAFPSRSSPMNSGNISTVNVQLVSPDAENMPLIHSSIPHHVAHGWGDCSKLLPNDVCSQQFDTPCSPATTHDRRTPYDLLMYHEEHSPSSAQPPMLFESVSEPKSKRRATDIDTHTLSPHVQSIDSVHDFNTETTLESLLHDSQNRRNLIPMEGPELKDTTITMSVNRPEFDYKDGSKSNTGSECTLCDAVLKCVGHSDKHHVMKSHHYSHLSHDLAVFRFVCTDSNCGVRTNHTGTKKYHLAQYPTHKMSDRVELMEIIRNDFIVGKSLPEYESLIKSALHTGAALGIDLRTLRTANRLRSSPAEIWAKYRDAKVPGQCILCSRRLAVQRLKSHYCHVHLAGVRKIYRYVCMTAGCIQRSGNYQWVLKHRKEKHTVSDRISYILPDLERMLSNPAIPEDRLPLTSIFAGQKKEKKQQHDVNVCRSRKRKAGQNTVDDVQQCATPITTTQPQNKLPSVDVLIVE